ncbi:hypothetical protein RB195_020892 [Necator americanus]|uniref:Uncharacterized protein n=1 Tax=Necator americanus TaxID=51031 RepID=A0ABR1CMZ7_NECAM
MLRLHGMMFLLLSIRSHAAIPAEDTVFFDADTEDITAEDEDGVNRTEIYPETTPSSQGDTLSQLHFSAVIDDDTTTTAGFLQEVKDLDSSTQSAATDSGTTAEDVQSTERPTSSSDTFYEGKIQDTTSEVTVTDPVTATSTSSPADDFYKKISEQLDNFPRKHLPKVSRHIYRTSGEHKLA